MKSFKNYIKEDARFHSTEHPNNLGGSLEVNPADLGNPEVLKRLNAIVGQIGNFEYLVAEHAIQRLNIVVLILSNLHSCTLLKLFNRIKAT